jgi:hypothetical protein
MVRQTINIGTVANDGTGDTFRIAGEKINDNFEELYTNFAPTELDDGIELTGNNIIGTRSNDNINFIPAGTGAVSIENLLIDNSIRLTDNNISSIRSNDNLELRAAGTGSIRFQSVSIIDNTISTDDSNANIELIANGAGKISINGMKLPRTDNGMTQLLKTDGSGTLSFIDHTYIIGNSIIDDGTVTVSTSATTAVASFSKNTYRSGKYILSLTDSTNQRYETITVNIVHDDSYAFISIQGSVVADSDSTEYGFSLGTFSSSIVGSDCVLSIQPISNDPLVINYVRYLQEI